MAKPPSGCAPLKLNIGSLDSFNQIFSQNAPCHQRISNLYDFLAACLLEAERYNQLVSIKPGRCFRQITDQVCISGPVISRHRSRCDPVFQPKAPVHLYWEGLSVSQLARWTNSVLLLLFMGLVVLSTEGNWLIGCWQYKLGW